MIIKIKKILEIQNDCQKIKFKVKLPVLGSIKNRQRNEKYEKTDQCRRSPIQIMQAPEIKKREKRGNYEKNNFLELKKNTISCIECTHQVSI